MNDELANAVYMSYRAQSRRVVTPLPASDLLISHFRRESCSSSPPSWRAARCRPCYLRQGPTPPPQHILSLSLSRKNLVERVLIPSQRVHEWARYDACLHQKETQHVQGTKPRPHAPRVRLGYCITHASGQRNRLRHPLAHHRVRASDAVHCAIPPPALLFFTLRPHAVWDHVPHDAARWAACHIPAGDSDCWVW